MAARYRPGFDPDEEYESLRRPSSGFGVAQVPVVCFDELSYAPMAQRQQFSQSYAQQSQQQFKSVLNADAMPFMPKQKTTNTPLASNGWNNDIQQEQQQQYRNYQHTQQLQQNGYMPQQTQQHHQQQQQQQQQFTQHNPNFFPRNRNMQRNTLATDFETRLNVDGNSTRNTPGGTFFADNAHTNFTAYNNSTISSRYHKQTYYHNQQQQQQQQQQQPQQRDKFHYNSANSKSNASRPGNGGSAAYASSSTSASEPTSNDYTEEENAALTYLQQVIQCLNENPGKYDTVATRFLTIFEGMEENSQVLSIAMEEIFQMSIQTPNFRYMGAKLYNLLYALNPKLDSLFHRLLKCKLDYHQKEVAEYMQANKDNLVRETALFLAELYMQLSGDGRLTLIGENILYSLKQLLNRETVENIRCVCMTLKLAGFDLSVNCASEMREIIALLEAVNNASPKKYPTVESVLALQKNNWGRKTSLSEELPAALRISDEPVFYGPDGTELTAEEAEFIKGVLPDDDDDDLDDDLDFDPEMDEETEKDYKEFLKLNASKS